MKNTNYTHKANQFCAYYTWPNIPAWTGQFQSCKIILPMHVDEREQSPKLLRIIAGGDMDSICPKHNDAPFNQLSPTKVIRCYAGKEVVQTPLNRTGQIISSYSLSCGPELLVNPSKQPIVLILGYILTRYI